MRPHDIQVGIVLEPPFFDIGDVKHRFGRDQEELAQVDLLLLGKVERAHRPAFVQLRHAFFQHADQQFGLLVTAGLGLLAVAVEGLFDGCHVGQRQFRIDHLDVMQGIDLAGDVHHVVVGKAAHHVHHGVRLADIGEELVAQAFALAGTGDQAGDIDELDDGGLDLLRLDDGREGRKPLVGHFDDADVGLDGTEGVILRRNAGLGQGVEEGGLADVGQSDDAAFEAHGSSFFGGTGFELIFCVAALNSPRASVGQTSRARSSAASISSRSSRRGGFST